MLQRQECYRELYYFQSTCNIDCYREQLSVVSYLGFYDIWIESYYMEQSVKETCYRENYQLESTCHRDMKKRATKPSQNCSFEVEKTNKANIRVQCKCYL